MIHRDPNILGGKRVIKGTRLSVQFVKQLRRAGWTEEQIIASYPSITADDIYECLRGRQA